MTDQGLLLSVTEQAGCVEAVNMAWMEGSSMHASQSAAANYSLVQLSIVLPWYTASANLQVDLGQVVLKRFLLLVLLLDRAAMADKLPSSAPLLFKKDGLCKKSSQVMPNPMLMCML